MHMHNPPTHMGWVKLVSTHNGLGISQLMHTTPNDREKSVVPWWVTDVNPVKNNETQQQKGTQDRSMDRFKWETSTRCL